MPGTFFGLETARRALHATRKGMDVAGHNIANANTEGYTRQEAVFNTTEPYAMPTIGGNERPEHLGSGAEVTQIRRVRNEYLDVQVRDSAAAEGYWDSRLDIFQRIEAVFPEPTSPGIQNLMIDFFNNWQELNNTPQDPGIKATVWETGDELAKLFRETYVQLEDIGKSIADIDTSGDVTGGALQLQVNDINNIVSEISELNIYISKAIMLDKQPNDLLDKRDLLLDKLAGYGNVNVINGQEPGMVAIKLYGQDILTAENEAITVSVKLESDEMKLNYASGEEVSLTEKAQARHMGSLSGLESARLRNKEYLDGLDSLAAALTERINTTLGVNFFTVDGTDGTGAKYFTLAEPVNSDPNQIDGTKALDVARLRNEITIDDTTFEGYYQQLIARVGAGVKESSDRLDNQKAIREQLDTLRESAGGVSIDEELTRMMQYQFSFQAAAKVVATIDEMLDVVVNGLKR